MTTPLADVTHVGIDADDTLWHSEDRFVETHQRFHDLLSAHVDTTVEELEARMLVTEQRNLRLFGYGVKAFTLSLIETAIELTDATIPATDIATILEWGKDLLDHPLELLDGAREAVEQLKARGLALVLITKGDLWHQEAKVAASGLADDFDAVEIISEKRASTYAAILARHVIEPARFCMVGNSIRSDVIPALELGAHAVHVPYRHTWAHEDVPAPGGGFTTLPSLRELPGLFDDV